MSTIRQTGRCNLSYIGGLGSPARADETEPSRTVRGRVGQTRRAENFVQMLNAEMAKPLIYVHNAGGLCNRLFPFATLLAYSQQVRRVLINPVFTQYRSYFLGTNPKYRDLLEERLPSDFLVPKFSQPLWNLRFRLAKRFQRRMVILRVGSDICDLQELDHCGDSRYSTWIDAFHMIHDRAVTEHFDMLRTFFEPIPPILEETKRYVARAREGADVLVGVHIRHGDYAHHSGGMLFYEVSEFRQLMLQILSSLTNRRVRFLVCSNVPQVAGDFQGLDYFPGPGSEIGDLYALARCDYIIAPASTYSCWASFYGTVPIFVHNRKYEEKFGLAVRQPTISEFRVCYGFGKLDSVHQEKKT